jgi:hypothetical protein
LYLARLARVEPGLLSPVQHRGASTQKDLALLRSRDALVAARTQLINHVRGLVKSVGSRRRMRPDPFCAWGALRGSRSSYPSSPNQGRHGHITSDSPALSEIPVRWRGAPWDQPQAGMRQSDPAGTVAGPDRDDEGRRSSRRVAPKRGVRNQSCRKHGPSSPKRPGRPSRRHRRLHRRACFPPPPDESPVASKDNAID